MLKNIKNIFVAFFAGLIYDLAIYFLKRIVYFYKDNKKWIK